MTGAKKTRYVLKMIVDTGYGRRDGAISAQGPWKIMEEPKLFGYL